MRLKPKVGKMYLEKLVINGFKSFTQPTEFKFDHPFVSIVGPNGSGKTNVSDAMRWVMGEQSMKLLRIKKATDAIFAGSATKNRLGMAQVDLYINNEDGRLNIEYPKVVISRRITRDGDTEYLLNKNKVRLHEILLLLAQANFGQKSYGVIGQGMVTDIVNANPQDRKDFFDEATGVKEFQIKRDQAINKLIRTEDNLSRVEDLLTEIKPRLNSLRRQVRKLDKRQAVEEQLSTVQSQYYGSSLVEIKNKLTTLSEEANILNSKKQTSEEALQTIETEIDGIGKEESRTDLYHRLQKEYSSIVQKKNDLLKEQAIIKGRLEVEHERSGEIDLLWLQRRQDDINNQINEANNDIKSAEQSLEHQQSQIQTIEKTQSTVNQDLEKINQQLQNVKSDIIKLSEILSVPEIKKQLEELFQEQEQFLRSLLNTTSLDQFKEVQQQAQSITSNLAELLDKLHEDKDEEVTLKEKEAKGLEARILSTTELKDKLFKDHTELFVAIQAKQEKITLLKDKIEVLKTEQEKINKEIEDKSTQVKQQDTSSQINDLQNQSVELKNKLTELEEAINNKKASLDQFNQAEEKKKQRLLELQIKSRQTQTELNQVVNKLQTIEIEIAKLQTKKEDLISEASRDVDAETLDAIKQWNEPRSDQDQLLIDIERLKHQLELIGGIDVEIIKEHEETKERYDFLNTQSKDLKKTIDSMEGIIDDLDTTIKKQFNKSFKAIAKSFQKYFKVLFDGGEAKIEILTADETEESDPTEIEVTTAEGPEAVPVEELQKKPPTGHVPIGKAKKKKRIVSGIDIIAQPPGKKLQSIHVLSGGEKSMTALALICAIIDANTPPFVVLDEVEAALDESNSEKFSAIIKQLSKKIQFVLITHNRATMHKSDVLYGVTMNQDGASHILSVKMTEAEKMLQADTVTT